MITLLSFLACTLTMVNSWLLSRGTLRVVYSIGVVNGSLYVVLNSLLAARGDLGLLFLVIPSGWGTICSVMGLRRLRKREQPPGCQVQLATKRNGNGQKAEPFNG